MSIIEVSEFSIAHSVLSCLYNRANSKRIRSCYCYLREYSVFFFTQSYIIIDNSSALP